MKTISEIRYLRQLEALGIKTPRRYKKITFIDVSVPVVFENILLKFL
jgi:tRNA A-37 threonylcarbamoyl transferase component Bud32